MPLADAVAGALSPGQRITWLQEDGNPFDLSNANLSGTLRDLNSGASRAIVGLLTVFDGPTGVFDWAYDLQDVVEGVYEIQFTAAFLTGVSPARTFVDTWRVREALVAA